MDHFIRIPASTSVHKYAHHVRTAPIYVYICVLHAHKRNNGSEVSYLVRLLLLLLLLCVCGGGLRAILNGQHTFPHARVGVVCLMWRVSSGRAGCGCGGWPGRFVELCVSGTCAGVARPRILSRRPFVRWFVGCHRPPRHDERRVRATAHAPAAQRHDRAAPELYQA